jgi:uncharacterized membrane protein YczE
MRVIVNSPNARYMDADIAEQLSVGANPAQIVIGTILIALMIGMIIVNWLDRNR